MMGRDLPYFASGVFDPFLIITLIFFSLRAYCIFAILKYMSLPIQFFLFKNMACFGNNLGLRPFPATLMTPTHRPQFKAANNLESIYLGIKSKLP